MMSHFSLSMITPPFTYGPSGCFDFAYDRQVGFPLVVSAYSRY